MKRNKTLIGLILVLLVGIVIRLFLSLTRDIYTDEVFYYQIARGNSIKDLFLMNHWMKDHGILYHILLKGALIFTSDIVYLRLFNILFYIGSAYVLFRIFKLFKFGKWALLPVFIFSTQRYFIYLSSLISPYNVAMFLALISIYCGVKIFVLNTDESTIFDYALFVITTVFAFYVDYSFLSTFIFYVSLAIVTFFKKSKKLPLYITYGVTLLLIIPGMLQMGSNLQRIESLNSTPIKEKNIFLSLGEFSRMTILHTYSPFSLYVFLLCLSLFMSAVIFCLQKKKYFNHASQKLFLALVGASYYISILLFLFINQFIFAVFVQRAFWFFFLFDTIIISIIIYLYSKRNKIICVLIILIYVSLSVFNILKTSKIDDYVAPGDIAYEIEYRSFLKKYISDAKMANDKYLILFDHEHSSYPLQYYYLSESQSVFGMNMNKIRRSIREGELTIINVNETFLNKLDKNFQCGERYSVVFFTDSIPDTCEHVFLKEARSIYYLRKDVVGKYVFFGKNKRNLF